MEEFVGCMLRVCDGEILIRRDSVLLEVFDGEMDMFDIKCGLWGIESNGPGMRFRTDF